MPNCEYRISKNQASENFFMNIRHRVTDDPIDERPQGVIVSGTEDDLCQVELDMMNNMPICDLPEMAGEDCPIAKWKRGEIDMVAANLILKQLFGQE
jgi:hypothetical protein